MQGEKEHNRLFGLSTLYACGSASHGEGRSKKTFVEMPRITRRRWSNRREEEKQGERERTASAE